MPIAKVFQSGNSQAVRLPKEFRFNSDEVEIIKRHDGIFLREHPKNLRHAFELLSQLSEDFFAREREDSLPQDREFF